MEGLAEYGFSPCGHVRKVPIGPEGLSGAPWGIGDEGYCRTCMAPREVVIMEIMIMDPERVVGTLAELTFRGKVPE